jgi:hypothetical protein
MMNIVRFGKSVVVELGGLGLIFTDIFSGQTWEVNTHRSSGEWWYVHRSDHVGQVILSWVHDGFDHGWYTCDGKTLQFESDMGDYHEKELSSTYHKACTKQYRFGDEFMVADTHFEILHDYICFEDDTAVHFSFCGTTHLTWRGKIASFPQIYDVIFEKTRLFLLMDTYMFVVNYNLEIQEEIFVGINACPCIMSDSLICLAYGDTFDKNHRKIYMKPRIQNWTQGLWILLSIVIQTLDTHICLI